MKASNSTEIPIGAALTIRVAHWCMVVLPNGRNSWTGISSTPC